MNTKISGKALLPRRSAMFAVTMMAALWVVSPLADAAAASDRTSVQQAEKVYRIGFHLWKPGKIYEEAMAGITDGLELEGIRYEAITLQSDRNADLAAENLKKMDAMELDLIYSLSSAGTKIAKRLNLKTPIIATVINHPASLGVGQGADGTDATRLTGTSYYVDAKKQMALYRSLFPQVAKVGMIYDSNNPAGYLAEEPFMREACKALGAEFVSVGIKKKNELPAAALKLINAKVNMIVVPTNRLVYANLAMVLDIANTNRIPVVSMNKQGVENGALAGLFADTYNLGRDTAKMARRILSHDTDPLEIEFQYITEPDVIVNLSSASSLNYEFPPEILNSAAIVME